MNKKIICSLIICLAVLGSTKTIAQFTYTWTGATNTNWTTASNWTGGPINTIPTVNDDVIIGATSTLPVSSSGGGEIYIGSGSTRTCKSIQVTNNTSNGTMALIVTKNSLTITGSSFNTLSITANVTSNSSASISLSGVAVNILPGRFSLVSGNTATTNPSSCVTTITGCNLRGNINNYSNSNIANNSTVFINSNTNFKGSLSNNGVSNSLSISNSTLSNEYDGVSRSYAALNNGTTQTGQIGGGSLSINSCILNNVSLVNYSSSNIVNISNSSFNYDNTFSLGNICINLKDSSSVTWINTNINVNANFYNGYAIPATGVQFPIALGKKITINGDINLNYTENNAFFVLSSFQASGSNAGLAHPNNFIDPATINGNINLKGGGIGFGASFIGNIFKLNGNINHIGSNLIGCVDIKNITLPSPNNFSYGGYCDLNDVNVTTSGRSTLILGGNTDTYIKWPTNFYMDQLVVDKQNCSSVTIDSSLVVGSNLKIFNGILKLPANQNFYKLVVFDSIKINNGGAIIFTDNGLSSANILMNREFSSSGSPIQQASSSAIIDSNLNLTSCTGLNLTANTKIVFGRGHNMNLANTTNPINIDFLPSANSNGAQVFNLQNNLNISSLNYTGKPRFTLNNFNLYVQTPITGYSPTQFINTNGSGQLRMLVGTAPVVFPIGLNPQNNNGADYNPATITNTGTPDYIGVNVRTGALSAGLTGINQTNNWVNKIWNISEDIMGGSNLNVTLHWITNELPGFTRASSYVSQYQNNAWDIQNKTAAGSVNGYYTQTRSGITSLSPFGVSSSATGNICVGNNFTLPAGTSGSTYQWQVNSGTGFVNLSDGINYNNTTTQNLGLVALPTSYYGFQYRCLVNGIASTVYDVKFNLIWNGIANSNWFNAANWNCSSLPDEFTDVIISGGKANYPIVNSNIGVRTLNILPTASLTVAPGITLVIKK